MPISPVTMPKSVREEKKTKAIEARTVKQHESHGLPESVLFSQSQTRLASESNRSVDRPKEGVPLPGLSSDLVEYCLRNKTGLPRTQRIEATRRLFGLKGAESGSMQREAIVGPDDRKRISNTFESPYKKICLLEFETPDGAGGIGTGWLIGPRTVVTAGHCIYNRDSDTGVGWMRMAKYKVYAGRSLEQFAGEAKVVDMATTQQYVEHGLEAYDFGVLYIDSSLGNDDQLGSFEIGIVGESTNSMLVSVLGYPGDKQKGMYGTMWGDTNLIKSVTNDRLSYAVDTMPGNSGGPVIYWDGQGAAMVVGIHNYGGGENATENYATRINEAVAGQLRQWNK